MIATALNDLISLLLSLNLMLLSSNLVCFQTLKIEFQNEAHHICKEQYGSLFSVPLSATLFYLNIINHSEQEANITWLPSELLHASFAISFLLSSKRTDLICLLLPKRLKIYFEFCFWCIDFLQLVFLLYFYSDICWLNKNIHFCQRSFKIVSR